MNEIDKKAVKGNLFGLRPIPKVDMSPREHDDKKKIPDAPKTRKRFEQTAFGRTVLGRNKTGEIVHGIIDVLPVPNVHEVVKKVVKDADSQEIDADYADVLYESVKRMDWTRTAVALVSAVLIVKGSDWLGIEPGELFDTFRRIIQLIGG